MNSLLFLSSRGQWCNGYWFYDRRFKASMKFFVSDNRTDGVEFPRDHWRSSERRQWWLSSSAIAVSLVLTSGIVSVWLPPMIPQLRTSAYAFDTDIAAHALVGMILLFDVYVVLQQAQVSRVRQKFHERQ